MRAFALFPLSLLLPTLLGCSGVPVSTSYADSTYDSVTTLAGPAKQREVPLLVLGQAFNLPPGPVEARIAEIMTRYHWGPAFTLVPRSAVDTTRGYSVIVLFDPGPGASGFNFCRDRSQPTAPDSVRLRLLAAFCEVGDTMTYTIAQIERPAGPDDPRFEALIRQTTYDIFPPRRGDQERGDRDSPPWRD